jgi:hypothetical protein
VLRFCVVALLCINTLFYLWGQGWLDSVLGVHATPVREPERLARQVKPETVRILKSD